MQQRCKNCKISLYICNSVARINLKQLLEIIEQRTINVIGIRKNMALLLLGIFLFPITFQGVHVIHHHMHDHPSGRARWVSSHNTHDFPQTQGLTEIHKDPTCLICNFQFFTNTLPKTVAVASATPTVEARLTEVITEHPYCQLISTTTPRAPPTCES